MSAYEAANNGFGDESFTPSGGNAWFGTTPAALPPAEDFSAGLNIAAFSDGANGAGAAATPVNGIAYAAGLAGFADAEPADRLPGGGNAFGDPAAFASPGLAAGTGGHGFSNQLAAASPTDSSALLPAVAHPGPPRPGPAGDVLRLVAVTAGLGQPSTARILADRLAGAARARLGENRRQVLVEVLELRDLALDIAGAMVAGFPGAKLRAALDAVETADGLIAVSPIYTASYSGLFKSFFDVLDKDALTGKPTLIAATGGTARHSLALDHALRPMFAYLRAFIVPTAVFAASEDWASAGEGSLNERIERAGSELADLMVGARATSHRRRDEFEDVVPFEQRMATLRSGI